MQLRLRLTLQSEIRIRTHNLCNRKLKAFQPINFNKEGRKAMTVIALCAEAEAQTAKEFQLRSWHFISKSVLLGINIQNGNSAARNK